MAVSPAPLNFTAVEIRRVHTKDARAAVDYAKQNNRSHGAVIRVFNNAGNVIETHNTLEGTISVSGDEAGILSEASETYAAESR